MYLADGAVVRNVHTCQPSMSLSTTDSPNVASRGGIVVGNAAREGLSRCPPNRFPIAFCSRKLATIARVTIVGAPVNVAGADAAGLGLVVNAGPLPAMHFRSLRKPGAGSDCDPTPWGVYAGHCHMKAGSVSQPRVEVVCASLALSMSTSQTGKRLRTSSSATWPSRRARAAPRQKCTPCPKLMIWLGLRCMLDAAQAEQTA